MSETVQLPVTIKNETRIVEFTLCRDNLATSDHIIACRIGQGAKLHRSDLYAYNTNGKWVVSMTTETRNRKATVINWADKVQETNHTNQNYYGSF